MLIKLQTVNTLGTIQGGNEMIGLATIANETFYAIYKIVGGIDYV